LGSTFFFSRRLYFHFADLKFFGLPVVWTLALPITNKKFRREPDLLICSEILTLYYANDTIFTWHFLPRRINTVKMEGNRNYIYFFGKCALTACLSSSVMLTSLSLLSIFKEFSVIKLDFISKWVAVLKQLSFRFID